jgi:hypothetical protein
VAATCVAVFDYLPFRHIILNSLANTSTQAFFSPDPEDADLIRATLSSSVRYGNMTLDLPSLQYWLRARLGGQWQPPTLTRVEPLARANKARVETLIGEVIAHHSNEYFPQGDWQERAVQVLVKSLPKSLAALLDELLASRLERQDRIVAQPEEEDGDPRRLGPLKRRNDAGIH